MRKLFVKFFAVFVVMVVLMGCAEEDSAPNQQQNQGTSEQNQSESSEQQEEALVQITISLDKEAEVIEEKEIVIEEGDLLLDVMKDNFDLVEQDLFITSIEGISAKEGEQKAWMFFVNGEMPTVGAADFELSDGDTIVFDFQSWE